MPAPAAKEAGRITDERGAANDKRAADEDDEDMTREEGDNVEPPELPMDAADAPVNGSVRLPRFRPDTVEVEVGAKEANDAAVSNEVRRALRLPGGDGIGRCDFSRNDSSKCTATVSDTVFAAVPTAALVPAAAAVPASADVVDARREAEINISCCSEALSKSGKICSSSARRWSD